MMRPKTGCAASVLGSNQSRKVLSVGMYGRREGKQDETEGKSQEGTAATICLDFCLCPHNLAKGIVSPRVPPTLIKN